jgi:recombination protein RecT
MVKTDDKGQIQKRSEAKNTMEAMVLKMAPRLAQALPRHLTPDRMTRIVTTAMRVNPDLANCTPVSFLGCVMQCAQLGLEPNTLQGHAYLIPFRNKKKGVLECTLIVGYKGMINLAHRSGQLDSIFATSVYEGDEFDYCYGLEPNVKHRPSDDPDRLNRPLTHTYAVAGIKGGGKVFEVLQRPEIEKRRARSKTDKIWNSDFAAMAEKTAIRKLNRWLPASAEMVRAEVIETTAEIGGDIIGALDDNIVDGLGESGLLPPDIENGEVRVEDEPTDEELKNNE